MIQVLSVDDHFFTRSGIRQVLDREADFAPMDEAAEAVPKHSAGSPNELTM